MASGFFYLIWLSRGRFGNPEQKRKAEEYIAAHEKMGLFEQNREKDVLQDATRRYFELLDEYLPVEKSAKL